MKTLQNLELRRVAQQGSSLFYTLGNFVSTLYELTTGYIHIVVLMLTCIIFFSLMNNGEVDCVVNIADFVFSMFKARQELS